MLVVGELYRNHAISRSLGGNPQGFRNYTGRITTFVLSIYIYICCSVDLRSFDRNVSLQISHVGNRVCKFLPRLTNYPNRSELIIRSQIVISSYVSVDLFLLVAIELHIGHLVEYIG